jgi:hypothetical protein
MFIGIPRCHRFVRIQLEHVFEWIGLSFHELRMFSAEAAATSTKVFVAG